MLIKVDLSSIIPDMLTVVYIDENSLKSVDHVIAHICDLFNIKYSHKDDYALYDDVWYVNPKQPSCIFKELQSTFKLQLNANNKPKSKEHDYTGNTSLQKPKKKKKEEIVELQTNLEVIGEKKRKSKKLDQPLIEENLTEVKKPKKLKQKDEEPIIENVDKVDNEKEVNKDKTSLENSKLKQQNDKDLCSDSDNQSDKLSSNFGVKRKRKHNKSKKRLKETVDEDYSKQNLNSQWDKVDFSFDNNKRIVFDDSDVSEKQDFVDNQSEKSNILIKQSHSSTQSCITHGRKSLEKNHYSTPVDPNAKFFFSGNENDVEMSEIKETSTIIPSQNTKHEKNPTITKSKNWNIAKQGIEYQQSEVTSMQALKFHKLLSLERLYQPKIFSRYEEKYDNNSKDIQCPMEFSSRAPKYSKSSSNYRVNISGIPDDPWSSLPLSFGSKSWKIDDNDANYTESYLTSSDMQNDTSTVNSDYNPSFSQTTENTETNNESSKNKLETTQNEFKGAKPSNKTRVYQSIGDVLGALRKRNHTESTSGCNAISTVSLASNTEDSFTTTVFKSANNSILDSSTANSSINQNHVSEIEISNGNYISSSQVLSDTNINDQSKESKAESQLAEITETNNFLVDKEIENSNHDQTNSPVKDLSITSHENLSVSKNSKTENVEIINIADKTDGKEEQVNDIYMCKLENEITCIENVDLTKEKTNDPVNSAEKNTDDPELEITDIFLNTSKSVSKCPLPIKIRAINYESYPLMPSIPHVGDIVGAKFRNLDKNFRPYFTEYRPAKVLDLGSNDISFQFLDLDESQIRANISHYKWSDLKLARLLYP